MDRPILFFWLSFDSRFFFFFLFFFFWQQWCPILGSFWMSCICQKTWRGTLYDVIFGLSIKQKITRFVRFGETHGRSQHGNSDKIFTVKTQVPGTRSQHANPAYYMNPTFCEPHWNCNYCVTMVTLVHKQVGLVAQHNLSINIKTVPFRRSWQDVLLPTFYGIPNRNGINLAPSTQEFFHILSIAGEVGNKHNHPQNWNNFHHPPIENFLDHLPFF